MERLADFLRSHRAERGGDFTHTCISKPLPGAFYIPVERSDEFLALYAGALAAGVEVCITERRKLIGPMVADIDLRFPATDPRGLARRYTLDHIDRIIFAYAQAAFDIFDTQHVTFYVSEKPFPAEGKECVKDGLHIVAPDLAARASAHYALRERVLNEVAGVLQDIGSINNVTDAVDEAVIERNAWMLYGSRKPGAPAYEITRVVRCSRTSEDDSLELEDLPLPAGVNKAGMGSTHLSHLSDLVRQLSIRRVGVSAELQLTAAGANAVAVFEQRAAEREARQRAAADAAAAAAAVVAADGNTRRRRLDDTDWESVRKLVGLLNPKRAESYEDWMRVGWCLHNIDLRLLPEWVEFSKRSPKFRPGECETKWASMRDNGGLGIGTLNMWAKQDAPEAYNEVVRCGLQELLLRALSKAHYDVARVVHHMFRHEFVCSTIRTCQWYEFRGHRWHPSERGHGLRKRISNDVWREFTAASTHQQNLAMASDCNTTQQQHQELGKKFNDLALQLKKTAFKENVMKECVELFYVEKFEEKLDSNTHLLCFENGVYDLKEREFREGRPDDNVSFSTGCDYMAHDPEHPDTQAIVRFFCQVQPRHELRDYLLCLFASCLSGDVKDQKFHIWTGSGSNGKSVCIELFERSMGNYTCKFPVTLLTQKRAASNAATSELARAKGCRMAVLQEPSEDEKLQVGLMKELTGGDTIMCRALFKDPIEYKPQYKLVLLCNYLPSVPSDDGGTWRRIRVLEFTSKFCDNPQAPNEFPIDLDLSSHFGAWAGRFLSMLIEEYWPRIGRGGVKEPDAVMVCTREYQNNNDHVAAFLAECVEKSEDNYLALSDAFNEIKSWVRDNNVNYRVPKKSEFKKIVERKMGRSSELAGVVGFRGYKLRNYFAGNPMGAANNEPVDDLDK